MARSADISDLSTTAIAACVVMSSALKHAAMHMHPRMHAPAHGSNCGFD